jgi:hypothetical protein
MRERGMAESLVAAKKRLDALRSRVPDAFFAAAYTVVCEMVRLAVPNVPIVSGELVGAGWVDPHQPVVGGYSTPYAAKVHKEGGRGHLFLERAVSAMTPEIANRMADLTEQYAEAGITLKNVPKQYPTSNALRLRRRRLAKKRLREKLGLTGPTKEALRSRTRRARARTEKQ